MKFEATPLSGAFVIHQESLADERGYFSRVFCRKLFEGKGLKYEVSQISESFNALKGTVRGLHYQLFPYEETKLVKCTQGSLFDVIVDLRTDSKTYGQYFATKLSAEDNKLVYIPSGFAHGFQTLQNDTMINYYMLGGEYHKPSARGYRWDDPAFAIPWPLQKNITIANRDREYPLVDIKQFYNK